MAMVINTNIASLNAQRNLGSSQKSMSEAMQRLSSGLRINSAKDDAAGLAIATRFTTQINGLNQAARNANDGISLAQTGEAALQEVTNNLQRIRELAIQSANSTNSADDRTALDAEVQQRITEINRISSQTSFNGQKVLDGSMGAASFQIGANVGETINIDLSQSMQTTSIGSIVSTTSGDVTANALADGVLTLAVGTGTATSVAGSAAYAGSATGQEAASAFAKAAAINATGPSGLTATASNTVTYGFGAVSGGDDTDDFLLTLNGVEIMNIPAATGAGAAINALDETSIAAAINAVTDLTGVSAVAGTGDLTLTSFDGRDISLTQDSTDAGTGTFDVDTMGFTADAGVGDSAAVNKRGVITMSSSEIITVGGTSTDINVTAGQFNTASGSLSTVAVTTVGGANDAILRIDAALNSVSTLRSDFGAIQNRFESTISNLTTISENLSASRSRIEDADFAAETAKMSRAQVLQQAGTAILSQANASTQSVLSLLQ